MLFSIAVTQTLLEWKRRTLWTYTDTMILDTVVPLLIEYRYLVMLPLIPIAQPIVGIATGVLIRLGFMEFPLVYPVIVGVTLLGDATWYAVGYRYGERFLLRFGRFFGLSLGHISAVQNAFHGHTAPILLLSKILNGGGFSIAVLFSAGMSRISFRKYMIYNVIGECIWSAMMIAVGYFFIDLYTRFQGVFGNVSLVIAGGVLLVLAYCALRVVRERMEKYMERDM